MGNKKQWVVHGKFNKRWRADLQEQPKSWITLSSNDQNSLPTATTIGFEQSYFHMHIQRLQKTEQIIRLSNKIIFSLQYIVFIVKFTVDNMSQMRVRADIFNTSATDVEEITF